MRIEFSRRADQTTTLRCIRDDGSVTWQNQRSSEHAAFFVMHDLTHYAVETVLGFRAGFYGLIASGWDIDDTTGTGKRGALPSEALTVEQIVGALNRERASPAPWTAADFNAMLTETLQRGRSGGPPERALTDDGLDRVRRLIQQLMARWAAVSPGQSLTLQFEAPSLNPDADRDAADSPRSPEGSSTRR